ncbi:MAG: DUF3037 domain-containing protein [Omnitrophica WOR_2 bacterium]|jgi:hypothetical protein
MTEHFIYSTLQYKHSLALGEILNVGILFYFPNEDHFEFVDGESSRVKSVYPDFDNVIFNAYLRAIKEKVIKKIDLFKEQPIISDFKVFINKNILTDEPSGFVFKEPVQVKNVFSSIQQAIDEYSQLLLPGVNIQKPLITKHSDHFILKQFNGFLLQGDKNIDKKLMKNEEVDTDYYKIKFELAWDNNFRNLIKPISFDLVESNAIINKAYQTHGLFSALKSANHQKQLRFNFLISKPQEKKLINQYNIGIKYINQVDFKKDLYFEDEWKDYSNSVISALT